MTSAHEQTGTPEQLPLGERYVQAAKEHAVQILEGAAPDEMAFRSMAVLQTRGRLGAHSNEWEQLDSEAYYLLADYVPVDKDSFHLEDVQSALFSGQFPKSAHSRLAALLVSGAGLFNRTVEQTPEVLGTEERYHEGNIASLEAHNRKRKVAGIGKTALKNEKTL
ncbi:MAG: hypothetical protein AAB914_00965 [Patescibacteria group bacterium]